MKKSTSRPRRMGDIEDIINKRLNSSWGRKTNSPTTLESNQLRRLLAKEAPRWNDVLDRCKSHPSEIVHLDSRSRTCLSTTCAKNPPVEVVREMMDACQFGMESTCDKTGLTALTIAIKTQASLEVVCELAKSKLMAETPDHRANTPLHLVFLDRYRHGVTSVCKALLESAPKLANMNNYDGKTPLHIAIETRASTEAVRTLLNAAPQSAISRTCGYTALTAAIYFNASLSVYQLLVTACPKVTRLKDEGGRLPLRCALEHRFNDANIIRLLCCSRKSVLDSDHLGRNTLHISLDRLVPNPQIVELLLLQAPEACRQRSKSEELPIQVAYHRYSQALRHVEARPHSLSAQRDRDQWWKVVLMVLRSTKQNTVYPSILHVALSTDAPIEVVSKLTKMNPEYVSLADIDGTYPVLLAARMDAYFSKDATLNLLLDLEPSLAVRADKHGRTVLSTVAQFQGVSESTIYRLICANPDAVRRIDPTWKMYPFMVAAVQQTDGGQHDTGHIGAIFEMVKAAPDLIN